MSKVERAEIKLFCHPELKASLQRKADNCNETLTKYVTTILAMHVGKLMFGNTPRNKMGRPKKEKA